MGFSTGTVALCPVFSTCITGTNPQRLGGATSSPNQVHRLNTILTGQKSQ